MGVYVFDNEWEKERERLAGLEALYDPGTIRHLESIGISAGWRCLEIGGGGGSIVRWLCARVGSNGSVLATDINTRFLDALHEPNLEVRKHDIVNDDLPVESFDLVHARLLLEHLPDRDQALKRIVSAMAPGGWLLVEDFDTARILAKPPALHRYPEEGARRAAKVTRTVLSVMQGAGYDPSYGTKLPGELIEHGLVDIGGEMRSSLIWGGSRGTLMPAWTLEQLRGLLGAAGISDKDIDREIAAYSDPNVASFSPTIVAAWGRKPESEHRMAGGPPRMRPRTESALDWMRGIPLFEGCTQAELSRIAGTARRVDAFPGDILTAEGDPGDTFYLIATGSATVTRGGARLAMLGPGSFFGEIAIIDRGPRTATVRAETPMRMFELGLEDFAVFFRDIPLVRERIQAALAERKARDLDSLE
jgi:SAM-dependent methyltransferase